MDVCKVDLTSCICGLTKVRKFSCVCLSPSPSKGSPIHFDFSDASRRGRAVCVRLTLPSFSLPIVYGSFLQPRVKEVPLSAPTADVFNIDSFELPNPLLFVSVEERISNWERRDAMPLSMLPLALSGCDYTNPVQRLQARVGFLLFSPLLMQLQGSLLKSNGVGNSSICCVSSVVFGICEFSCSRNGRALNSGEDYRRKFGTCHGHACEQVTCFEPFYVLIFLQSSFRAF
jgi:hypothetical protein